MQEDHIRYDILAQEALRGVIRKVLSEIAITGHLPGDHHFFITFMTNAPGVRISPHLKARYAEQMTIVIQHQFWDLKVTDTGFEIGLSFSDVPEKLAVPFTAIRGFYDPSVNFELEFDPQPVEGEARPEDSTDGSAGATAMLNPPASAIAGDNQSGEKNVDEPSDDEAEPAARVTSEKPARHKKDRQAKRQDTENTDEEDSPASGADVVSLDAFRKKN